MLLTVSAVAALLSVDAFQEPCCETPKSERGATFRG